MLRAKHCSMNHVSISTLFSLQPMLGGGIITITPEQERKPKFTIVRLDRIANARKKRASRLVLWFSSL